MVAVTLFSLVVADMLHALFGFSSAAVASCRDSSLLMPSLLLSYCTADIRKIVAAATQNNINDMSMGGMDQCF
jgi:hypothetical protein